MGYRIEKKNDVINGPYYLPHGDTFQGVKQLMEFFFEFFSHLCLFLFNNPHVLLNYTL